MVEAEWRGFPWVWLLFELCNWKAWQQEAWFFLARRLSCSNFMASGPGQFLSPTVSRPFWRTVEMYFPLALCPPDQLFTCALHFPSQCLSVQMHRDLVFRKICFSIQGRRLRQEVCHKFEVICYKMKSCLKKQNKTGGGGGGHREDGE